MSYAWSEFLKSGLATLALPCFFVAPGYLAGMASNLLGFRQRSMIERLLWSLVLSLPLAIIVATHPGIPISQTGALWVFRALAMAAAIFVARDLRRDLAERRSRWDHEAMICTLGALGLLVYCLAAATPIQTAHGLYESAAWQDWDVRIQLVNECLRAGNQPGNPMFALRGVAAPAHYYYFWYVLCAQLSLLTGAGARAALTASCVGAAMALVACVFLSLKYLGVSSYPLRRQCVAALLTGCVIGLDIIPTVLRLILPFKRVYPDIQLWLDDRSPSWLGLLLWSPHHVGGVVCCVTGTMLVVLARGRTRGQQVVHAVLAAVCFAAAAGASTFVMGVFSVACLLIVVDAALRREWETVRGMIVAGVLSLLIAAPLLYRMLSKETVAPHSPAALAQERLQERMDAVPNDPMWIHYQKYGDTAGNGPPIKLVPRYTNQARFFLRAIFQFHDVIENWQYGHVTPSPGLLQRGLRPLVMILMFVADFGFFLFVLVYRIRRDLPNRRHLDRALRIWWLILLGIGVPGFLLTSAPMQSNNDLGRHAGMCLRFVLTIWAAPLVAEYLDRRRLKQPVRTPGRLWVRRLAVAAFVLGLTGELWQVLINRFDMELVDAGKIPAYVVASRVPHIGWRFEQIRLAMQAAARATPPDAVVQDNPHGRLAPVYLLYTSRQMAASDEGCNIPFGGQPQDCLPVSRALVELFGGTGPDFQGEQRVLRKMRMRPEMMTVENFERVCQQQKIALLVATYSDPAWHDRQSWVWQLQPIYANSTSRVYACSAAAAKQDASS